MFPKKLPKKFLTMLNLYVKIKYTANLTYY